MVNKNTICPAEIKPLYSYVDRKINGSWAVMSRQKHVIAPYLQRQGAPLMGTAGHSPPVVHVPWSWRFFLFERQKPLQYDHRSLLCNKTNSYRLNKKCVHIYTYIKVKLNMAKEKKHKKQLAGFHTAIKWMRCPDLPVILLNQTQINKRILWWWSLVKLNYLIQMIKCARICLKAALRGKIKKCR